MSNLKDFVKDLANIRKSMWSKMAAELRDLSTRTGIMQPAGTILYADADTRILHEFLWELRLMAYETNSDLKHLISFTCRLILFFRKRLEGYYFLTDSAEVMKNVEVYFMKCENSEEYIELMDEFILYVGRISMWIDLLIPWYHLNEIFKKYE